MQYRLNMTVNNKQYSLDVKPWKSLRDVLREQLGLTGTKCGCSMGACGACAIVIDGMVVKSCLILAPQANGRQILTVEGLAEGEELHPVQQAFIDNFAVQCGYCTPGMLMTAKALLDENPVPSEEEIREYLHGNICRCTGYTKIIQAVMDAGQKIRNAV